MPPPKQKFKRFRGPLGQAIVHGVAIIIGALLTGTDVAILRESFCPIHVGQKRFRGPRPNIRDHLKQFCLQ
ncbi:hypothetical protein ACERK3_07220 [Phycisphaerales bacterium AB-hyl4]|uniref:Uncharacterized protein n=1 Tax=Natronomicrosphaera hydrolytica TaxID=3242702 RepID=A0ABV4U3H3_9BACT